MQKFLNALAVLILVLMVPVAFFLLRSPDIKLTVNILGLFGFAAIVVLQARRSLAKAGVQKLGATPVQKPTQKIYFVLLLALGIGGLFVGGLLISKLIRQSF